MAGLLDGLGQSLGGLLNRYGGLIGNVGAAMPEAYGANAPIMDPLAKAVMTTATLPQRAMESSANMVRTGQYDPAPILEAAMLPMGTGAIAGVPMRAGEAVLGSGAVRKSPLPMDEASRMARAQEQGYTIDAYKGGQPYDWNTLPEYYGNGKVVHGTESRVPVELTSINSPNAPYAGFFSHDPKVADRFAAPFEHGAVWPTKLKFENPLVIDAQGKHAAAFQFESIARDPKNNTIAELNKFHGAFKEGSPHDGVILKNTKDEGTVYIPRNPDQIRSRFAAFDPDKIGSGELLGGLAGAGILAPMVMQRDR